MLLLRALSSIETHNLILWNSWFYLKMSMFFQSEKNSPVKSNKGLRDTSVQVMRTLTPANWKGNIKSKDAVVAAAAAVAFYATNLLHSACRWFIYLFQIIPFELWDRGDQWIRYRWIWMPSHPANECADSFKSASIPSVVFLEREGGVVFSFITFSLTGIWMPR